MQHASFARLVGVAGLVGLSAGCGGGDVSPWQEIAIVELLGPQQAATGESVGIVALSETDTIESVRWRQVAGPAVVFHAGDSKAIGFDVPSSGDYVFEATVATTAHGTITRTCSFSAGGSPAQLNARLDRAVLERSSVSLRASYRGADPDLARYTWTQTEGPSVTLTGGTDQPLLLFSAPQVASDTLVKFRVSATAADGRVASDEIYVLVEDATIDDESAFPSSGMIAGRVHVYETGAPHAAGLAQCVYTNTLTTACTFATLPLIGQESGAPGVADIMKHVVVSHDWMGRRFEEYLADGDASGDIRRLLRSVTAIVISAEIRPSFYWDGTAAIYIDPMDLWQTADERDTILETPDYRSNFDQALSFAMPWRLVRNDDYATGYYPPAWRGQRPAAESHLDLASLLYHELAHAADFLPPARLSSLTSAQTPYAATSAASPTSDLLAARYPLASEEMRGLADVAFGGATATAAQSAYQPADVVGLFTPDDAVDFYSYSAAAEDLAELFSFLMMRARFGVDADIAVSNHPTGEDVTAYDYIVTWGERGRVGEERIKPRVRFVAQRVLPELDVDAALASLPAPRMMRPGVDWVANLDLNGSGSAGFRMGGVTPHLAKLRPVETLPRHTLRLRR